MSYRQGLAAVLFGLSVLTFAAQADEPVTPESVFGEFVGSSPCGPSIRPLLEIPKDVESDLIEWKLTLLQDPRGGTPAEYKLRCDYGTTAAGRPGLANTTSTLKKAGRWKIGRGTRSNPDAVVFELDGALAFFQLDPNVLHVLNPDRSLMIGTSGWSYTLNRTSAAEQPGDLSLALSVPSVSYSLSPLASGPGVFGVFEGRTPARGILRELNLADNPGATKCKWRITLYQDSGSRTPTTYKVESTFYRQKARTGKWSIISGIPSDPRATVYQLEPANGEAALFLLKGDDDVLFFLDRNLKPLVGHAEFSYTLHRRDTAPAAADAPRQD